MEPRRSFLTRLVAAGAALIGAGMAGLTAAVAVPRSRETIRKWRAAASMFDLPPTGPLVATPTGRHADGWHGTRRGMVGVLMRLDEQASNADGDSGSCKWRGEPAIAAR